MQHNCNNKPFEKKEKFQNLIKKICAKIKLKKFINFCKIKNLDLTNK